MQARDQTEQLFEAIANVRRSSRKCLTNLFAGREEVQFWIEQGALSWAEVCGSVLIHRQDRGFRRLYHIAPGAPELSAALAGLRQDRRGIVVADLVGLPADVDRTSGSYRGNGFREYTSLVRMSRPPGHWGADGDSSGVVLAQDRDLTAIGSFLERVLDRFRDRIPGLDALRDAIARSTILIERSNAGVLGLLLFANTGMTSELRYWYVDPGHLNRGIGGRLFRRYLAGCTAINRFLVWVVDDNENAVFKYERYGYRRDLLVDRIMIYRDDA
jgi:GNAT superfamily N-acetyltransferase